MNTHTAEVESGQRFEFGKNWLDFLSVVTEDKLRSTEVSMRQILGTNSLTGKRSLCHLKVYWHYDGGSSSRGMNRWHDIVDWIGGYPFEIAKPEEIFDFFKARGLNLLARRTCAGGIGCNEYFFRKASAGGGS